MYKTPCALWNLYKICEKGENPLLFERDYHEKDLDGKVKMNLRKVNCFFLSSIGELSVFDEPLKVLNVNTNILRSMMNS